MSDTIPGGRYRGTDGELHDANGNKIGSKENKAAVQAGGESAAGRGDVAPKAAKRAKRSGAKRSGAKAAKRSAKPK